MVVTKLEAEEANLWTIMKTDNDLSSLNCYDFNFQYEICTNYIYPLKRKTMSSYYYCYFGMTRQKRIFPKKKIPRYDIDEGNGDDDVMDLDELKEQVVDNDVPVADFDECGDSKEIRKNFIHSFARPMV